MVIVLGALTIIGIVAAVADTALLRRRPPAVRAQAVPLAAHHPGRAHARHYPPRHRVTWAFRWVGMLLILVVAVVSVPAVVDGVAYLARAGNTATRGPVLPDGDRAAGPAMFLEVTLVVLLGPVKRSRGGDLRDDPPSYRLLLGVA